MRLTILMTVLFVLVGCNGDNDDSPTTPVPTSSLEATLTREPTSRATTIAASEPTLSTGIEIVDNVIEAVETGDAAALAALMRTQQVPCSARSPMGGPPADCAGLPKEGVPPRSPDAVVDVFPEAGCEVEIDDGDVAAIAERTLPLLEDLYAVVRFEENVFESEPYYPEGADYGVIFTGLSVVNATPVAWLFVTYEGAVVYFDSTCGGGPEVFLGDAPPYRSAVVIARGPAFDE